MARIGLILAALVTTAIALLYLPPVQDFISRKVTEAVSKSPDMNVSVGRFRLYFPLDVELDSVLVTQHADTMISVGHAEVDVALLPLLKGEVAVRRMEIGSVVYAMGNPDSAMWLRARVGSAAMSGSSVAIFRSEIDIDRLRLSGGDIELVIQNDTVERPTEPGAPVDWVINAREITFADIDYRMSMMPAIDSLDARIPIARLLEGRVDLGRSTVDVKSFSVDSINAVYLTTPAGHPSSEESVATAVTDTVGVMSQPWTINVSAIDISDGSALYGVAGAVAFPGLDMNRLQLTSININVDSFYNRGAEIRVPLRRLTAHERCGIDLHGQGLFVMDSVAMHAEHFEISTLYSSVSLDALMGMAGDNDKAVPVEVDMHGYLSPKDVAMAMPSTAVMMSSFPAGENIEIDVDVDGSLQSLNINDIKAGIPRAVKVGMKGHVTDVTDVDLMSGSITLDGRVANGRFIKPALVQARLNKSVNLPPLTLRGNVRMNRGTVDGKLRATTSGGDVALDANWTGRREQYKVNFSADSFPVDAFLPLSGIGKVSAKAVVDGHGYDIFSEKTAVDASVAVIMAEYLGKTYRNLTADAHLAGGRAGITASSVNRGLDFQLHAAGNLDGKVYD